LGEIVVTLVDKIHLLIIGFGFGASFMAMFAQLEDGIYTKVNLVREGGGVNADLIGEV